MEFNKTSKVSPALHNAEIYFGPDGLKHLYIYQSHTCYLSGGLYVFFSQSSLFCLSPGVPEGTAAVKVHLLPSLASGEAAPRVTKVSSHTPQGINGSMPSITGYAGAPGKCFQICLCLF